MASGRQWETELMELICQCAQSSKNKNYNYFGISNYRECWSAKNVQISSPDDNTNQCISRIAVLNANNNQDSVNYFQPSPATYEVCHKGSLQCAGRKGAVYIYKVIDGKCSNVSV